MRVLAVGAHPFDIELGCGGALLAHRDRGDEIHLLVMTGESSPTAGIRKSEQLLAAARLGATLHWGGFEEGAVPHGREAVAVVESVIIATAAEVVYGHAVDDAHQDHRATAEAVGSAARAVHDVLCYESPSTTRFIPQIFVDLEGRVGAKLDLIGSHRSQLESNPLVDLSGIAAQCRFRGGQARVNHAEGFETPRFIWDLGSVPHEDADVRAPFGARSIWSAPSAAPRPNWMPDAAPRGTDGY